jgi:hypothetical protein
MSEDLNSGKNKTIFKHPFTFPILLKISLHYRPSQIAKQLAVTEQAVYYHTDRMIDAGLLYKDTNNGIRWILTKKGLFVLKQKLTGSVNSFNNYQTKPVARLIPTRLDNISFAFKILEPLFEDVNLKWSEMKNGVSKCSIKYENHTVEIVRSEKSSAMLIHLEAKYCFDWTRQLIDEYNLAISFARRAAARFRIQISEYGRSIKRPHIAFEYDLIALFVASSYTAEIETNEEENKAWIDSSSGLGELETNNPNYAYLYLIMPQNVNRIAEDVSEIRKRLMGYAKHLDPLFTENN